MTITPAANRFGTAIITLGFLRVSDGQSVRIFSFALRVDFSLRMTAEAGDLVVTWTDTNAALQEASQITGPWRDIVPVPVSPYPAPRLETKFYRLQKR